MTRKQAMAMAEQILSERGQDEAAVILHNLSGELYVQATRDFIREYLRIRPVSAEDYNARRTSPLRGWYSIAKYNHARRWRILLEKLSLPIYNNCGTPPSAPQLKVRVISDYYFESDRKP